MAHAAETQAAPPRKRRRRILAVVLVVVIALGVTLALLIVPYHSSSQEIQVASGAGATTSLTVPTAGWVTVHFSHPSAMMSMRYWMQGPGGMMFDHSMMSGSDSYSFWSWGGTYQCGAGYTGSGYGMMPIWVNATWGIV